jgi:PD-(D/E)XK nuclease superfamily
MAPRFRSQDTQVEEGLKVKRKPVVLVKDIKPPSKKEYDIDRDGITQSLLSTALSCERKFLFAVNRWTKDVPNKNTAFGSMFHEMIDKAYHEPIPPKPRIISKWLMEYTETKLDVFTKAAMRMDIQTMTAVCQVLVEEYCIHYADDWKNKKFTAIERAFNIIHKAIGTRLRGKKDARYDLKKKEKTEHWIMEHKTKSQIDEEYLMLALVFDFQNLFYITAEEYEFNINVSGVLYNVVRNPGTKQRKMEPDRSYAERIRKEVKKRPEHYFKRFEVSYPKENKEVFKKELAIKINRVRQILDGKRVACKNETACNGKFKCSFLEACSSGRMVGYKQKEKLFEELA